MDIADSSAKFFLTISICIHDTKLKFPVFLFSLKLDEIRIGFTHLAEWNQYVFLK